MNDAVLEKRLDKYVDKRMKEKEKVTDMDIVIKKILTIPPGQVKKFFNDDVIMAIFKKYGYKEEDT